MTMPHMPPRPAAFDRELTALTLLWVLFGFSLLAAVVLALMGHFIADTIYTGDRLEFRVALATWSGIATNIAIVTGVGAAVLSGVVTMAHRVVEALRTPR